MLKTRTNITRYPYSRGPVRQVCLVLLLLTTQLAGFPAPIAKLLLVNVCGIRIKRLHKGIEIFEIESNQKGYESLP